MSYKRYLFETGGFRAYEYALVGNAADEELFADIHKSMREAGATIVGLMSTLAASLKSGAILNGQSGGYDNYSSLLQLDDGYGQYSTDNPSIVANSFAKTPFVGMKKESETSVSLLGKALEAQLVINPFDKDQERLLAKLMPGYVHPA